MSIRAPGATDREIRPVLESSSAGIPANASHASACARDPGPYADDEQLHGRRDGNQESLGMGELVAKRHTHPAVGVSTVLLGLCV